MKPYSLKIGGRIWKTVIAVFLCLCIDAVSVGGLPFYAAIAAILCVQRNQKDSFQVAMNREISTVIGGIFGMLFLAFERYIYQVPINLLRYALLSLLLIPVIKLSLFLRQEKGTFLMCVVFLCVTVTHEKDLSPVSFAINRIVDTTIGSIIALLINHLWRDRSM